MPAPLSTTQIALRLAFIGAIIGTTAGAFAYDAGWFSPGRLTQDKMIAAFVDVGGLHPGFRRNHAKGVCVSGSFASSGAAAALSRAAVFAAGAKTAVVGRISLSGPMPYQADAPQKVRAMGLRMRTPGLEEWRTAMIDLPVFPVKTARGFYDSLYAGKPDPATGKPDPAKMQAFVAAHPEAGPATDLIKARKISTGFASTTYNSLHAFAFVAADGTKIPVRWSFVSQQPFAAAGQKPEGQDNYLFDGLIADIRQHKLQWRMVVSLGEAGDDTADPTIPWPADRKTIEAGTLTVDAIQSEDEGRCTSINYDPTVLPDGIAPSNDPLLSARSAAYAESFKLRAGETKPPSAITAETIAKDGKP